MIWVLSTSVLQEETGFNPEARFLVPVVVIVRLLVVEEQRDARITRNHVSFVHRQDETLIDESWNDLVC